MYQSSFNQQRQFQPQQVQSQYRGLQKTFQPTGYVQSFYQPQQQYQSFSANAQAQNYHASNYVGNQPNHDVSLREDSLRPSSYVGANAQGIGSFTGAAQRTFNVNMPTSQMMGGFQATNSYHNANYVGNQPDHDAYLREDSLRASSYAMGQSQGIGSLNQIQGSYRVNVPTSQIQQQGQFMANRGF